MKTDKGQTLEHLHRAGFPVPPFFIVSPYEPLVEAAIRQRCLNLAGGVDGACFAVRSSAQAEDGHAASYAGMFETFLFVPLVDVIDRIRRVRESGATERVRAYDALQGGDRREHATSTIVQLMVDADISGVAFGRDPVDGSDRAVIVAAYGLGSAVVAGESDTDTYRVAQGRDIVERHIAHKTVAHRRALTLSGVQSVPVSEALADSPALCDAELLKVVDMLRAIEARFGDGQDVEWAISTGRLFVLQSRPITTAAGTIWDNSNIAESYGGLVSPLTFSFARHAYSAAYRELMRVFGIDRKTIAAHGDVLHEMLGLVGGHMYYNLLNWYRLLALIPGFRLNRRFMESMMGVREPLPRHMLYEISRKGKARDLFAVAKMLVALLYCLARLRRDTALFHRRTAVALAASPHLPDLDARELLAEFSRLEHELLANWRAPLVNDFFAMIFYGTLRSLSARWFTADEDSSLPNDLLCAAGGMVSTEPAHRIAKLADLVRGDKALALAVEAGDVELAVKTLRTRPRALEAFNAYLERFGNRCPNELKLESSTLHQNPLPLLQAVVRVAAEEPGSQYPIDHATSTRCSAERRVSRALHANPLRRMIYAFVVDNARCRIRERENLRLERTRVFARARSCSNLDFGCTRSASSTIRATYFLSNCRSCAPRSHRTVIPTTCAHLPISAALCMRTTQTFLPRPIVSVRSAQAPRLRRKHRRRRMMRRAVAVSDAAQGPCARACAWSRTFAPISNREKSWWPSEPIPGGSYSFPRPPASSSSGVACFRMRRSCRVNLASQAWSAWPD